MLDCFYDIHFARAFQRLALPANDGGLGFIVSVDQPVISRVHAVFGVLPIGQEPIFFVDHCAAIQANERRPSKMTNMGFSHAMRAFEERRFFAVIL